MILKPFRDILPSIHSCNAFDPLSSIFGSTKRSQVALHQAPTSLLSSSSICLPSPLHIPFYTLLSILFFILFSMVFSRCFRANKQNLRYEWYPSIFTSTNGTNLMLLHFKQCYSSSFGEDNPDTTPSKFRLFAFRMTLAASLKNFSGLPVLIMSNKTFGMMLWCVSAPLSTKSAAVCKM